MTKKRVCRITVEVMGQLAQWVPRPAAEFHEPLQRSVQEDVVRSYVVVSGWKRARLVSTEDGFVDVLFEYPVDPVGMGRRR